MYHLEPHEGLLGRLDAYEQNANRILGARPSIETLWNLAPWSWLSDWWLDIGTVISNARLLGEDGQVLRYGYLMKHSKVRSTYRLNTGVEMYYTFTGGTKPAYTGPITNIVTRETKERVKATPYGFGITLASLSAKQWAILGALGLTRAPSVLA
jgi:hypothetical protein